MKKLLSVFALLMILSTSLASCGFSTEKKIDDYEAVISVLQGQIVSLKSEQERADEKHRAELEKLNELISQREETSKEDSSSQPQGPTAATEGFKYSLSDGVATVTGYIGSERNLVIPASIDGHRVVEIADSAFAQSNLKNVIISDGIERIGWFAFDGCTSLEAVTIPSCVTEIGYSALGSSESGVTIFCHADSFALQYCKSYGLTYTII